MSLIGVFTADFNEVNTAVYMLRNRVHLFFCIHCSLWSMACMLVLCYTASTAMELISSKSLLLTSALYLTVVQDWASLQEGVLHPV